MDKKKIWKIEEMESTTRNDESDIDKSDDESIRG